MNEIELRAKLEAYVAELTKLLRSRGKNYSVSADDVVTRLNEITGSPPRGSL